MRHPFKLTSALAAILMLGACTKPSLGLTGEATEIAKAKIETQTTGAIKNESAILFEAGNGETVNAFEGFFTVPENRANPDSRMLTIHYVRFPAITDTPGAPIVYLAGGPGGSGIGTAKRNRFPLFMAMRQHGDVIAYDQRGTGRSNDMERCTRPGRDLLAPVSDTQALADQVAALESCMEEWEAAGIDLDGYDTVENARDLEDLRKHLNADQISLWGISYGSHLGLAALRELEGRIDKAIFASIEGLEQTVKLPARTDDYFDRLQDAMSARDPETPDIKALIRRVHANFEAEPKLLNIGGTEALFHRRDLQNFLSGSIADPKWAMMTVGLYQQMDQGDYSGFEQVYARWGVSSELSFSPMSRLTDIASGTDARRREKIDQQAVNGLVGWELNAPYAYEDIRPELVMGPEFREPVRSDVSVLMLSGTLDGRTYPEAAREAMVGLPNTTHILIEDAGHNLFMTSPKVGEAMHRFMRGETDLPKTIRVPIPD